MLDDGKIPKKEDDDDDEASFRYNGVPEEDAWLVSRLFFLWEKPLFRRAYLLQRRGEALQYEDLLPLPQPDHGNEIGTAFESSWEKLKVQQNQKPSQAAHVPATIHKLSDLKDNNNDLGTANLTRALLATMGSRFITAGLIKALNTALQFCFPVLLNGVLKFIEQTQQGLLEDSDPWYERYRGYWLAAILFLAMGTKAVTENVYFHRVYRAAYQAKVAVSVSVYNKSLRLSNAERQSTTLGKCGFRMYHLCLGF